jgi:hypothetical protein
MSSQRLKFASSRFAAIGGALEFCDFIIFVFFAQVMGKLFFAVTAAGWVRQAQVFGIFSAGYVAGRIGPEMPTQTSQIKCWNIRRSLKLGFHVAAACFTS